MCVSVSLRLKLAVISQLPELHLRIKLIGELVQLFPPNSSLERRVVWLDVEPWPCGTLTAARGKCMMKVLLARYVHTPNYRW